MMEGSVPHVASFVDNLLDRVLHSIVVGIQEEPHAFLQTLRFVWKIFVFQFSMPYLVSPDSLVNDKLDCFLNEHPKMTSHP